MTKRLALAICTVAAALTAALTAPVVTALADGPAAWTTAGERPSGMVDAGGMMAAGRNQGPTPPDTSWGG